MNNTLDEYILGQIHFRPNKINRLGLLLSKKSSFFHSAFCECQLANLYSIGTTEMSRLLFRRELCVIV